MSKTGAGALIAALVAAAFWLGKHDKPKPVAWPAPPPITQANELDDPAPGYVVDNSQFERNNAQVQQGLDRLHADENALRQQQATDAQTRALNRVADSLQH